MSIENLNRSKPDAKDPNCLIQTVAAALADEPALEAVKIDRKHRSISVATLGQPKRSDLEDYLSGQIKQMDQADRTRRCSLLDGKEDCSTCLVPLDPKDRSRVTIQHDCESTTIARVTCPTAPRFWRWHNLPWPKVVPREIRLPDEGDHDLEWKSQLVAAGLCGALGLAAFFLSGRRAALPLNLLAYLAGGWFTVHEVWERLEKKTLDVHFLMLAVALGSASIGAWSEGAMLLFLFSLSGALEHYAMGRTQREIRSLFKDAPKSATVLDENGREFIVPVDRLEPGMRLLIKPGDQFPVDAEIVLGKTASDESNLTGEAAPVEKSLGDTVLAGTLNLWGVVEVNVLRKASQSALQKIIQLIREAQHLKAPSQRFTDLFGTRYTYAILSLSLGMFLVWWLAMGHQPFVSQESRKSAFYLAMTLLVVSSPCALVLSIPSAVLAAIAWAARRGILFRGGAAVENLAGVKVVAMDKTGTLTTGELAVESIESFPPGHERQVSELAFALERLSTHPLARAITRYGKQQHFAVRSIEQFESVAGLGLQARVGNAMVHLGRREWVEQKTNAATLAQIPAAATGLAEVWLASNGLLGRILLRDDIRPQARGVVRELHSLGLQTLVLTGDRRAAGEQLKERLGISDVHCELKPEQKVEIVHSFAAQGRKVAMIGDGVNDAPSLAAADVGVAMGARGSDSALEQAEIVLMHDRLENFLTAFQLSKRAQRVIRQNLFVSLGTVIVLVLFAISGTVPLTVGVLGHEGSTVIVVLNSLRLLFNRPGLSEKV